jgi:5-deoxy-5-amino-3-dehydroquinate synthase
MVDAKSTVPHRRPVVRSVPVALGDRSYEVLIGAGVRTALAPTIAAGLGDGVRRAAIVTQANIESAGWLDDLDPGVPFDVLVIPDGERSKTLETVTWLCRRFAALGLARSDVVVALGGGLVSDIAGFAAAAYHRGVAYVNVPTSLLAQVDAAIGGKTGVNLPEGKNLVGAFWQPAAVLCDTEMLSTLAPREWACGRGEMAKYAFLGTTEPDLSLLDLDLDDQVARCVSLKAAVVAADERESGGRMLLNYGHTLAHALEALDLAAGERATGLRHGEAVAIGLMFAAHLAQRLGRIDETRVDLHRRVLAGFDLSAALPPGTDPATALAYMERDKKAQHDLTFVLDGPSGIEVVHDIDQAQVAAALAEFGAREVAV